MLSAKNVGEHGELHISDAESLISEEDFRAINRNGYLKYGDLLLTIVGTIGRAAVFQESTPLAFQRSVAVLRPTPSADVRFLYYATQSSYFQGVLQAATKQSAQGGVYLGDVAAMPIVIPSSVDRQHEIVEFLDRETARVDDLIRRQNRFDELLVESRKAIVATTVCRGLGSSSEFKESGIGWLGEIPSRWKLTPVKRLFRLIVDPAPEDNGMELLSLYTDIGVRPRKDLEARGNRASTTDGYFRVRRGDFIFNKLLAWMGAIGLSDYEGVTSPAYDILRPSVPMVSQYYNYLFRCGICLPEFRRHSRGIMDMRLRLYFDKLGPLLMPEPPLREQTEIVEFLDRETSKIDEIRSSVSRCMEKLTEYRSALVSAAVTGQIDVRDYKTQESVASSGNF